MDASKLIDAVPSLYGKMLVSAALDFVATELTSIEYGRFRELYGTVVTDLVDSLKTDDL